MGQVELAQITGLSRQTVSNYERGIVTPRRSGVTLWALATGVPLGWLLTGEEPE
jgi:transcriptional regulator with XRE-family HTH domain